MGTPVAARVQSSLNMILPIKSWLQFKESSAVVHFKERQFTEARESVGAMHFARFVDLRDNHHLGYFAVFDGDFRTYFRDFISEIGPAFDALMKHVVDGPPVPCEGETFAAWGAAHNQEGIGFYSAQPTLTVRAIKELSGIHGGGVDAWGQSALTLVLPVKSPAHFAALSRSLTEFVPQLNSALDALGAVYFLRFVPWGTHAMILVAEHDFPLTNVAHNLSKHLGAMFDAIFENVTDGPPTPVLEHTRSFTDWIVAHNLEPWGLYSAYPTLTLEQIRGLAGTPSEAI